MTNHSKASTIILSLIAGALCPAFAAANETYRPSETPPFDSLEMLDDDETRADALIERGYEIDLVPPTLPFDILLTYTALYQSAHQALAQNEGFGADLDIFASYTFGSSDAGPERKLVLHLEGRHRLGKFAPADLSGSIGNHLSTTTFYFNEQDFSLVELYYDHENQSRGYSFRLGKHDPGAVFNTFTWGDPETGFLGGGVVDAAIAFPDLGWGFHVTIEPSTETYLTLGVFDANADATKIDFGTLGKNQYFVGAEAGYTPRSGVFADAPGKYSVLSWHRDKTAEPGSNSGHGIAFSGEQALPGNPNIVPFLRYSWANGAAAAETQVSVGVVFQNVLGQSDDVIGLAASRVELADASLRDESTFEAFYRFHVTPEFSITPDVQLIEKPAKTTSYDRVTVLSLRARVVF
ncbi:MAG: carbohydrate porin [Rhodobacteraceae bacterium]|nr:carbohydrate porin [Paracoccaceae bacterium]